MDEIDYPALSRAQRLAIFLIVIGPETAAEMLRQFEDADIEAICTSMAQFKMVPDTVRKLALDEFAGIVVHSANSTMGGISYAQHTLELAKGDYKASAIIGRLGGAGGTPVDVMKDVAEMDGRQIFNLVRNEQPQTIAFVLSYLDSGKAAEVFNLLSPELRDDVIERLGTLEATSLDLVAKITRSFGKHQNPKASRPAFHRSGGVRAVADLLNQLGKDTSKALLTRLEERNADLGGAIRKKLFSFEDISRLQLSDLQRVLREVEMSSLAIAMKSASAPLREKLYGALSKRAAEGLKEELEMLGSVRLKDVEAAQETVIRAVRQLEEEGEITLDQDNAKQLVS